MDDVVTVQLRFAIDTSLGVYQDSLYFTEEEWAKREQKVIDVTKQDLADKWVVFRSAQIKEEETLQTIEGKNVKIAELEAKISDLEEIKAQLQSEIISG